MNGVTREDVARFLSHLEQCDLDAAVQQTMALFGAGLGVDALITSLLAPAQQEIGDRWQAGVWSVGQEHQSSAVVDACLSALGTTEPVALRRDDDWIAVGAVEGEWHEIPARMVSESLRAQGWKVRFLGASVSAERLRQLADEGPRAVLLSCSLTASLGGAARCLDTLAEIGIPSLVGGHAFGASSTRAERLGAAAWAPDARAAAAVIDALAYAPPPSSRRRLDHFEALDVSRPQIASEIVDALFLSWPELAASSDSDLAYVRTHAELMVGALVASALVDDADVFVDLVEWVRAVVDTQRLRHPSLADMLDALDHVVTAEVPAAAAIIERARHLLPVESALCEVHPLYDSVMPSPESEHSDRAELHRVIRASDRFEDAAEAIRARARRAADRVTATAGRGAPEANDALARLRQQAQQLLSGVPRGDNDVPPPPTVPPPTNNAVGTDALAASNGRAAQVLEAARAQAARLLDEAESDASAIRAAAHDEGDRIRAAAQVAAAEVLERAEAEALEWLGDAGRQVVAHLDEVEAEATRILTAARAEAARITAEASRAHADMTANAADAVRQSQQEAERQLAQATAAAGAMLAKARSDAATILADAQAEHTRLAEETEHLAASASELLEARLNEVEAARAEAAEVRATADAAIEADTRRLLGEAQADCDRIIAEARAEAERIRQSAMGGADSDLGIDLRELQVEQADERQRRRFRQ